MEITLFMLKICCIQLGILLIAIIGYKFLTHLAFPREGKAQGICKEVRVELTSEIDDYLYPHRADRRSYRVYIQYEYKGVLYMAKSYRMYSAAKYFPGDTVMVWVNKNNKNIVDIIPNS
jgi:hypothetical protein